MSNDEILRSIVYLRKRITSHILNSAGFTGTLSSLEEADIKYLDDVQSITSELYFEDDGKSIEVELLTKNIGKSISFNISTGTISYYETLDSFIDGNSFSENVPSFYIHDIDFYKDSSPDNHTEYQLYKKNLQFINILRHVADYEKNDGKILELFFYNSGDGAKLKIAYKRSDLKDIPENVMGKLNQDLQTTVDKQERLQIFKYELICLINEKSSYSFVLVNFDRLINNYSKTFEIYLTGFSIEKLQTASNRYFIEFSDKIQQTIGKVSNYIFAIPVAFIFLLRYFDFKGDNFVGDSLLLTIGFLFLILVWLVPFKNISESINSIEEEINDFNEKINSNNALLDISSKLLELKSKNLGKQRNKLAVSKTISVLIFLIVLGAYVYIHFPVKFVFWFFLLAKYFLSAFVF